MAILSTETWSRIKTIAGALAAVGGLCYSMLLYAESKIDDKIKQESNNTSIVINKGLTSIQRQLLTMEERLIRSDIKELLRGKNFSELTSEEIAMWEELKSEQELIKIQKRDLDKLIKNKDPK